MIIEYVLPVGDPSQVVGPVVSLVAVDVVDFILRKETEVGLRDEIRRH